MCAEVDALDPSFLLGGLSQPRLNTSLSPYSMLSDSYVAFMQVVRVVHN